MEGNLKTVHSFAVQTKSRDSLIHDWFIPHYSTLQMLLFTDATVVRSAWDMNEDVKKVGFFTGKITL